MRIGTRAGRIRICRANALRGIEIGSTSDRNTWRAGDHLFRLYGVQSCLRGTSAEEPNGNKIDCGNISLAHLAALFDSAAVTCQPIGYALDKAVFSCAARS
ncbi:hypothetical protein AJ88_35750 [Mesorhizobium amorphae CCBAU 01583]|nr:hypothetical protein AJ88_35750 [Mesorhizobium amorphae CCBAU 01583]